MKKFSFAVMGVALSGLLFITGCSSSDIKITLNDPKEDEVLTRGDDVHFDMDIESPNELKEYEIHIHGKMAGGWDFEEEYPLTGKNINVHHHDIIIPADAAVGKYDFEVKVKDVEGNEAKKKIHVSIQ